MNVTFPIIEVISFIALMILIWYVSKWPRWHMRAMIYGWAAVFLWAIFWCALMPDFFKWMGFSLPVEAFPDGTLMVGALFGGWFWPLITVSLSRYLERRSLTSVK